MFLHKLPAPVEQVVLSKRAGLFASRFHRSGISVWPGFASMKFRQSTTQRIEAYIRRVREKSLFNFEHVWNITAGKVDCF